MKVYSVPDEVAFADPDYANYDSVKEQQREAEHQEKLKQFLIRMGYNGPLTGKIARFGHADGYACYMFMDGGRNCGLVHLPYGDAWDSPLARYMPKRDVVKLLDRDERLKEIFSNAA